MRAAGFRAALILAAVPKQSPAQVVTPQVSNTSQALIGLHAVNDRVVWAGGAGGTFLRTTDGGGNHCALLPTVAQPAADSGEGAPAASGTCVVAKRPGNPWIGTIGGKPGARVLRTADRGRSWQSTVTPIGHRAPGSGIFTLVFRDKLRGFAAGSQDSTQVPTGRIARTIDGGRTWRLARDPAFKGTVYGLTTVPGRPRTLLATGPGGASISPDDGRSWKPLDAGNYWTIAFASATTGWMVGSRGRIAKVRLR